VPDGRVALASFLSAFLACRRGSFETKIDEAVDSLLADATDGGMTMADIRAFATGEIGLTIMSLSPEVMESDEPPMVIGMGISDRAAAEAFVGGLAEDVVTDTYGSATLYVDEDATVAVADEWILLSPQVDQIQAAVDVLDGSAPSLAET
jgi:hypothetical protein